MRVCLVFSCFSLELCRGLHWGWCLWDLLSLKFFKGVVLLLRRNKQVLFILSIHFHFAWNLEFFWCGLLIKKLMICSFSATILPVVQKQHQLLVTLLLCNAAAMEVSCWLSIYVEGHARVSHNFFLFFLKKSWSAFFYQLHCFIFYKCFRWDYYNEVQ